MNKSNKSAGKIGFVSLGCPKATVDSEQILTQLRIRGYEMAAQFESADLVVINTCGFIETAVDESFDAIAQAIDRNGKVMVTGCLGARGDLIKEKFPQLLSVSGPNSTAQVLAAIDHHLPTRHNPHVDVVPPGGLKLTPRHYAYLKISEGCNHHCSFCIIPQLRGQLVSRPISQVLREAEALCSAGVKELLLVAQDTSAYGVDLGYRTELYQTKAIRSHIIDLARELGQLDSWIRLHYIYPYPHVDQLLDLMQQQYILPYLDIPFQHASLTILKAMKRPAYSEKVLERISRWRQQCPQLSLRSTFIVGFPGETEQDFTKLLEFLEHAEFNRAGCFAYSAIAGASANDLPGAIPEELKQARLQQFMATQAKISSRLLAKKIGQKLEVIVDLVTENKIIARSQGDAPEIDGIVEISGAIEGISAGDLLVVKITAAGTHDLYAQPLPNRKSPQSCH